MSVPSLEPTPWGRALAMPVALAAILALIVLAFLWPARTSEPRGLPILVAGPAAQAAQLAGTLEERAEGVFAVTTVEDRDAAVGAIERREAYGAVVLGTSPEVLTASAASAVAAQALAALAEGVRQQAQQLADGQAAQAGADAPEITVTVTDVVPLAATDPRGAGLAAAALPLTIGGLFAGALVALGMRGGMRRAVALVTYAVAGGLALAAILQGWFGVLQGEFLANAAAIGLALLASGAFVCGLTGLLGRAGVALGAVTLVLLAVPIASVAAPVEFLPVPWGAIGQWLPPGAAAALLRDLSYFPAADVVFPWLVLAGWAVGGLVLVLAGRALGRDRSAGAHLGSA